MGRYAERARAEGWLYRELPTEHDLQLFDPDGTVEVLDDLAKAAAQASIIGGPPHKGSLSPSRANRSG